MSHTNHKPPRVYERVSADLIVDDRFTEADVEVLLELELKAGESGLAIVTIPWLEDRTGRQRGRRSTAGFGNIRPGPFGRNIPYS
jgi:hypothetical protein